MKGHSLPRHRGHTLLEALVVLGIILLLSAGLYPVLSRAREAARTKTCASNLRQIGLAVLQYTQDYEDRMPGNQTSDVAGNLEQAWPDMIHGYVRADTVFICPADLDGPAYGYQTDRRIVRQGTGSYSCNTVSSAGGGVFNAYSSTRHGLALSQIQDLAGTIAIADGWPTRWTFASIGSIGPSRLKGGYDVLYDTTGTSGLVARHKGVNVLFCDGHVKMLALEWLSDKHWWTTAVD